MREKEKEHRRGNSLFGTFSLLCLATIFMIIVALDRISYLSSCFLSLSLSLTLEERRGAKYNVRTETCVMSVRSNANCTRDSKI